MDINFDAKSCITNNGQFSAFFTNRKKGVRQGCLLCPYLFIIVPEILSQYINSHRNIQGIQILSIEVNQTHFPDDATFILDGTEDYFQNLISTLEYIKILGLKLNNFKRSVLRI